MAAPGVLFLLLLLLLLLLLALTGTPSTGATHTLPPPSNVRYSVNAERCQLTVSWDPLVPNCTSKLTYTSVLRHDPSTEQIDNPEPFRNEAVDLGKEILFGVRIKCRTEEGPWYNLTVPQKGKPGTGAVNISCIWHNEEYITCSWKAGENATQGNYNLFYGYEDQLDQFQQCTNSSRDGNNFRCTFTHDVSLGMLNFWISVKGASEDVRPVCVKGKDLQTKLYPPSRLNVSKDSDGVILKWTKETERQNLEYEIEIKDTATGSVTTETSHDQTSKQISLKPNAKHTFRVRVIPKEYRYAPGGTWSDWSVKAVWDESENDNNTFYTLLYIFIPLCVAVLTIIVLVYLKRIKLLILPKIPDPGQVLKKMFEDQSEDLQKHPTYDVIKDEQIHPLTVLERTGNEV